MAQMILSTNQKQIMNMESRVVFARGWAERRGKGIDREFGANRCKTLHLERINNGVLLYSIGNNVQCLGVEHDGR